MPKKTNIINIVSIKGGVGKSVIALAIANCLAREYPGIERVLYLDTDFSGTCTRDGINEKDFHAKWRKNNQEYLFLEELIGRIGTAYLKENPDKFFEQFPDMEDPNRLWLAFSSKNYAAIRKLSYFLDIEQYTDLILRRLLDLCGNVLQKVKENAVVIMDNGPGIYGLAMSLLNYHEDLEKFVKNRNIALLGQDIVVTHLFIVSPDRQDIVGMRDILEQKLTSEKFSYYVVLNLFREKLSDKEIKEYVKELPQELFDLREFESRFHAMPLLKGLRLFEFRQADKISLWKKQEWDENRKDMENYLFPIINKLIV